MDDKNKDLGLAREQQEHQRRRINKNGSFNVNKIGAVSGVRDLYMHLVSISWSRFFIGILATYTSINLFFAIIYFFIGPEHLTGLEDETKFRQFLDCFFFSTQTFATVGYGAISPTGILANSIASLESLVGLLSFALATGLLFGRFSMPNAKFKFSENVLISPYRKDIKGLMFRVANKRKNTLLETSSEVIMLYDTVDEKGDKKRDFKRLDLEISEIKLFPTTWTIVHPITKESPIFGFDKEKLMNFNFEILVIIKSFDETYGQNIYGRTSFTQEELIYQAKFDPPTTVNTKGEVEVNLNTINDHKMVDSFDIK